MDALITKLESGEELGPKEITASAKFLLESGGDDEKKKEMLRALSAKGETPAEIAGFVESFLKEAINPEVEDLEIDGPTIDICGTGGDKLDLFNVSTTSMFVLAAGGATVMKHGNRSVTSKSGSADVLEALGIGLNPGLDVLHDCIEQAGVGFMFAPVFHPAFKQVAEVRRDLAVEGIRTIFNLVGPLLNPARPECQMVGVSDPALVPTFAEILQRMDRDSAWVVCGETEEGHPVDELSVMGRSLVCKSGAYQEIVDEEITPEDFGLDYATVEDLQGGDAEENADILTEILSGVREGHRRDMVLFNAGAGLACAGLADSLGDGIESARDIINSGEALERLKLMQAIAGDA